MNSNWIREIDSELAKKIVYPKLIRKKIAN